MRAPKGSGGGARETVAVYPGNWRSLVVLTLLGAMAATDAGRVEQSHSDGIWIAPELVETDVVTVADCVAVSSPDRAQRFEKIAVGDDAVPSIVKFAWHPDTGELSFTTQAALTLPESFVTAASGLTSRHCE